MAGSAAHLSSFQTVIPLVIWASTATADDATDPLLLMNTSCNVQHSLQRAVGFGTMIECPLVDLSKRRGATAGWANSHQKSGRGVGAKSREEEHSSLDTAFG
jgi:hypothetical protein